MPRDRSWPPDPEPLPAPVVDGHTHLDTPAPDARGFDDGPDLPTVEEQLARAAAVGVTAMVQVGCDLPAAEWTAEVVTRHDALLGAVALHPNEAPRHAGVREIGPDGLEPHVQDHHAVPLDDALARIADLARTTDRIRAIGESGLDHFRSGERGRAVQREAFRAHIALAKELGLPLQVHDRDAHAAVLEVLDADGAPERTVIHCFSGDAELARALLDRGCHLSFAGTVTFRGAADLRSALHEVPADRLLVETDAPFLTPHPFRGRPCAPYVLPWTVRAVAEIRGEDLATLCGTLRRTSEELYGPW